MVVGLKVYKVKDKENYEKLKPQLSGWCFFRSEDDQYFIKAPLNNSIKTLIEMGIITEQHQMMTE
jgi:hypothetical protein